MRKSENLRNQSKFSRLHFGRRWGLPIPESKTFEGLLADFLIINKTYDLTAAKGKRI
jgi:hypothetical protein